MARLEEDYAGLKKDAGNIRDAGADVHSQFQGLAVLRNAVLDGADLVKASLHDVDASGASCRGTQFMGALLQKVDFRSADLREAIFKENSFQVVLDEETKLDGATGTVLGPAVVVDGSTSELTGAELEEWIHGKGGRVRVVSPRK